MEPRIGVLTSGGDCPGLNAVLRAVVLAADKLGWEVVGFRDGFEGLLPPGNHVIVDRQAVNGIMALGGTILGTTNRGHFVAKVGAGDRTIVSAKIIADARKILEDLGVRALIVVGGDGSLVTAQQLQEAGKHRGKETEWLGITTPSVEVRRRKSKAKPKDETSKTEPELGATVESE